MLLTLLTAALPGLTGCSDDAGDGGGSAAQAATPDQPLPENLCDDVLGAVSAEWGLAEEEHETAGPTAACTLTGPGATTLVVTLTDTDDPDATLDLVCRTAVGAPLEEGQRRCEVAADGPPASAAFAASYAETSSVVVAQLQTSDDTVATTAPAELASVESALQSR